MDILFKCLLAFVVLAPLPFGGVLMWSWSLMGLLVAAMLAAWGALQWRAGAPPAVPLAQIWPAAALFGLALLWAFLQTQGWMPASWHHPLWRAASDALGRELAGSISLNPFAGHSTLLRLLAYAGVFWLALQLCRDRARARLALKTVAVAGAVYAAYGIAVQISGSNTLLWFHKTSYFDVVTSTFVNRNSYATYAGLGLLAMTAHLVQGIEEKMPRGLSPRDMLRRTLLLLFNEQWPFLTGWILLLAAVVMTESRGGVVAAGLGLTALVIALGARRTGHRKLALRAGLAMMAGAAAFLFASGDAVLDRLGQTYDRVDVRPAIYATTVAGIADTPVLGTGLGSFPETYRIYSRGDVGSSVLKAHDTYLENALELGIPGAAALALAVLFLAGLAAIGVRQRERDSAYPITAVAATVLVGVHSLVDFSLQIPAVTVTFCFLLGLGCAQSWSTRRS